ncbi:hypothetical protein L1987_37158 [Smallanthus sonchifolius]|uniref:Uncharacterized protein n=1 Tax=Smallanthus sonchifolius TaxID=185202 RepID=A0ACB9HG98_9ASTR|nr:hypothetical protein L1987_37158 [Smallanthus sonchifolius]
MKFAFKIDFTKFNLETRIKSYRIYKLTDDPTIMRELQKKFNIKQSANSESLNITFQDFDAYDTLHLKDVTSMTGDNSTPIIELEKSTGKSLMMNENNSFVRSTHCDLKRNLEDVYEIDESTNFTFSISDANNLHRHCSSLLYFSFLSQIQLLRAKCFNQAPISHFNSVAVTVVSGAASLLDYLCRSCVLSSRICCYRRIL